MAALAMAGYGWRAPVSYHPGMDRPLTMTMTKQKPARTMMFRRPGFLVRRLHQIYVAIYFQNCERFGTTPVQSSVMQVLLAQPGMDQIALAGEIGIDRTTTSSVLSRLEARGIVKREADADDRRTKRAYLTSAGKAMLQDMQASIEAAHKELVEPLPPADRKQFLEQLLCLVQANNDKGRSLLRNL
jgi:MarR family transcriptional regulator, lower aerobic nicotinate degradation pathway regulator